jgi:hypothetical protein
LDYNDVYHDIRIIKKLRNGFAHHAGRVSLDDDETRKLIESLRVPNRQFYDWGQLCAASTLDGIVIYTGEKPPEAREELHLPGAGTFKRALPLVVAVLVSNLGILFATKEKGTVARITLPKHMELDSQVIQPDSE